MKLRISKLKLVLLMAMSVFGLWASSMVLVVYYFLKSQLPLCPPGQSFFGLNFDCDKVLGSRFSQFFGIPLELFAVAYFVINLVLVYLIAFGSEAVFRRSISILFVWRFLGLAIVPYLVFIEVFVLKAICVYCTVMHISIVVDFIIISYFLFYHRESLFEPDLSSPESLTAPLQ